MGKRKPITSTSPLKLVTANKIRRRQLYIDLKRSTTKLKHDERQRRRKEERQDPELRRERLQINRPKTIEDKREFDKDANDSLGAVVDVAYLRRCRLEQEEANGLKEGVPADESAPEDDDVDSMLGSDEDIDGEPMVHDRKQRRPSIAPSVTSIATTTVLGDLTPESLIRQFPSLFQEELAPPPKILVTTSLNATIHNEAIEIASVFPNSTYIRRSAHRFGHKYSVREIARFARNRGFTALLVVTEDLKKPVRLTIVHLPLGEGSLGPTLTYSISNYLSYRALPNHGNHTAHYPELLLNGFKTPLGLLAARSFHTLFPPQPELAGRQVTTLHNQREAHRYIFRDKKDSEKSVTTADGKPLPGVFGEIRTGLQELVGHPRCFILHRSIRYDKPHGPRFTLKLRRVDKGVGRAGSEGEDAQPWEWKAQMDVKRTRFQL